VVSKSMAKDAPELRRVVLETSIDEDRTITGWSDTFFNVNSISGQPGRLVERASAETISLLLIDIGTPVI